MTLTYTKVLRNGETLELYHGGGVFRLLWVQTRPGRKPVMLDYEDHTSYVRALARFERVV